jgi:hypothetical protein
MSGEPPPRALGIGQRLLLAVVCQIWLFATLFGQRYEFEFLVVSIVQLVAVALFSLRLRHMRYINDRWIRVVILLVVLLVVALDLAVSGRVLAGLSPWSVTLTIIPIAAVLAFAGAAYCYFKTPTRMMLLLYTISYVAGMRAVALIFSGQGSSGPETPGIVTIMEGAISIIYPVIFIFRGQYSPVARPEFVHHS